MRTKEEGKIMGEGVYSPAQLEYAEARKKVGKVEVDHQLMDLLGYGLLWYELDTLGEEKLKVLCRLIGRCVEGEISEVHLACGLGPALQTNRKLRSLGLDEPLVFRRQENLRLGNAIYRSLSSSVVRPSALTRLELNGIFLTPDACRQIGQGLSKSESLRFFSICNSKCGDKGFSELYPGIAANTSIQDLVLSGCDLSNRCGMMIAQVIRSHAERRNDLRWGYSLRKSVESSPELPHILNEIAIQGLLAVDLSNNKLGDKTAESIARALAGDEWIGAINLARNRITKRGVDALYLVLDQSNSSLAVLDFRDNADENESTRLDALLRGRSSNPQYGLLSRQLPPPPKSPKEEDDGDLFNHQNQDDNKDSEVYSTSVIAGAILRWQSGHQLSSSVAGVLASIASFTNSNLEISHVHKQIIIPGARGTASSSSSSGVPSQSGKARKQQAQQVNARPMAVVNKPGSGNSLISKMKKKNTVSSSRSSNSELHISDASPIPGTEMYEEWESAMFTSQEDGVTTTTTLVSDIVVSRSGPSPPTKENAKKKIQSKKSTNPAKRKTKKKVASTKHGEGSSKRRPRKEKIAMAFADEVNKAIQEYAAQLDNPDVAQILMEKCKTTNAESLDSLERSVEHLYRCLDRISSGTQQSNELSMSTSSNSPLARSPKSLSGTGGSDHGQIVDDITEKVAQRLNKMWNSTSQLQ